MPHVAQKIAWLVALSKKRMGEKDLEHLDSEIILEISQMNEDKEIISEAIKD